MESKFAGTIKPKEDGVDIIDVLNPLHHIPIVDGFYRDKTGDTISPASKIAGGAVWGAAAAGGLGAALGAGSAAGDVAVTKATGKDIGQHTVAISDKVKKVALAETGPAAKSPSSKKQRGPGLG